MAYKIDFHPEADAEFDKVLAWYQEQKEGLEQDFFDEYRSIEKRLIESPFQFPIILENIRRAIFVAFSYSIFFAIDGESIFIYAIFHQKRDPLDWEARL